MRRIRLWKDEPYAEGDDYTAEGRRQRVEDDGMKAWEEAFWEGWENAAN